MFSKINPKQIGWPPYVYLMYIVFLFVQPIFDPTFGRLEWLFTFGLLVIFLPAYFTSFLASGRARLFSITVMAVLGLIGTTGIIGLFNPGANCFYIYAAAAAASVYRPRRAFLYFGFILSLIGLGFWSAPYGLEGKLFVLIPSIFFTLLIGFISVFEAEQARNRSRLELANDEIEHLATIAERERIARDLHDLLGHTLSVITLKSELASKLIDKDVEKAKTEIQEVERISRETLTEVRSAVSGYRQEGFMSEVASAKLALESANVSFAFKGDTSILTALQESTLSLVLREAVTNIIRHAEASRCFVELTEVGERLELEIIDDGIGMQGNMGNGLSGIRDRIVLLGGRFDINSFQGVRINISLPKELSVKAEMPNVNLSLETS